MIPNLINNGEIEIGPPFINCQESEGCLSMFTQKIRIQELFKQIGWHLHL